MFESPVVLSISPNQRQALYFVRSQQGRQIFYRANIDSDEMITLEPLCNKPGAVIQYCAFVDDENIFITYMTTSGVWGYQVHNLSNSKFTIIHPTSFFTTSQGKITDDFCRVLLLRNKSDYQVRRFNDPTPKTIHFLKHHTEIFASVATQDYLYVVTSSYQRLSDGTEKPDAHKIDLKTGIISHTKELISVNPYNYYLCFNAKARHLLLVSDAKLCIYSTADFVLQFTLSLEKLDLVNITILEACLNNEGTALALLYQTVVDTPRHVYYFDLKKRQGQRLFSFGAKDATLAFAGNKILVCTNTGVIHKRDLPIY